VSARRMLADYIYSVSRRDIFDIKPCRPLWEYSYDGLRLDKMSEELASNIMQTEIVGRRTGN
jgi:hypothetical protein